MRLLVATVALLGTTFLALLSIAPPAVAREVPIIVAGAGSCQASSSFVDVSAYTDPTARRLGAATGVPVLADLSLPSLKKALTARADDALLLLYVGHGQTLDPGGNAAAARPGMSSALCIGSEMPTISELVEHLPRSERHGAVFVVSSCSSAYVDLRKAKRPTAVISASPRTLSVESGFAEALALALAAQSETDANCDGLITDQELFDRIVEEIERRQPLARAPAFPKLRREAATQIPLPLVFKPGTRCQAAGRESAWVAQFADALDTHQTGAADLQANLRRQLALSPRGHTALPGGTTDYLCVDARAERWEEITRETSEVATRAEGNRRAPMTAFPGSCEEAARIGRFAIFAEVYVAKVIGPWVRLLRTRDNRLVGVGKLDADRSAWPQTIAKLIPPRVVGVEQENAPTLTASKAMYWRVLGSMTSVSDLAGGLLLQPSRTAVVPCLEEDGQCYMELLDEKQAR